MKIRSATIVSLALVVSSCSRDSGSLPAGKADMSASRGAAPEAAGPVAAGPFDARFIDMMIPHHAMAVQMAHDALAKAQHAELRELAQSIATNQQAEIQQMNAWREAWYPGLAPTPSGSMIQTTDGKMDHGDNPATRPIDDSVGPGGATMTARGLEPIRGATAPLMGASSSASAAMTMTSGATGAMGATSMASAASGGMSMATGAMGELGSLSGADFDRAFIDMMIPHHAQAVDAGQRAQAMAEHQELRDFAAKIVTDQKAEIAKMEEWRREWFPAGASSPMAASGAMGPSGM